MKKLTEQQIISNHFSKLAKVRQSKMTKEEKSAMGKKMIKARWDKWHKEHGKKQTKSISRG